MRLDALMLALGVLLLPAVCLAWGPATHVDFGLRVLDSMLLLPPLVRRLLSAHPMDFLYGNVAADIVVGKNMARYHDHCHNWVVARRLLDRASGDAQRALSWGYLSHLAADVVAHNYYVPVKTVQSYPTKTTGHAYWEIRFDQLANEGGRAWSTFKEVGRQKTRAHDRFLMRNLKGASRLMPMGTSRRLFNSMMLVTRLERWRRTTATLARRSPWQFGHREVHEYRRMAVGFIISTLRGVERAPVLGADPTGARNLKAARELRKQLKRLGRQRRLLRAGWAPFYDQVRRGFRDAIAAPLRLPSVVQLDRG